MAKRPLKSFSENVYVNLLSGVVLFVTSGVEIVRSIEEAVGAHHGVALFALLHIIKVLPEVLHGADEASKLRD